MTALIANSPYIGLFVLLILGGIGVPLFPEDATFILCGFLIQARTVKTVPALLVIYIGVLIADFILYSFGRKYGRMVVCHRWFHRFLSPEKLTELEGRYKRKGIFVILFGRHFIGLRVQIFIVSGIMRMHPLKFLLADAVTVIFTIAVMVSIGYVGGHSLKDLGIHISKTEYLAIFCLASFITGWLVFKYIQKKKSRSC
jgi:membrane protein DedA with SNARE-associated domain